MKIIQLSLFVENRPGALNDVCRTLKENNINISTLSLADTKSFGILRLLVKEHEKAKQVLEAAGFVVKTTEVLAVPVANCQLPRRSGSAAGYSERLSGRIHVRLYYRSARQGGHGFPLCRF